MFLAKLPALGLADLCNPSKHISIRAYNMRHFALKLLHQYV